MELIETREFARLSDPQWRVWGPYLSERQWGSVREDYSENGDAWDFTTHDMARSRAYRWGEEGIGGLSDNQQILCFAPALWNRADPILKERLFGLTGQEGNHGEDCKELYYYLDSTPSHSYMRMLYKYPQAAFPYQWLLDENRRRSRTEPEFELLDTGVFNERRYFDVFVEYAKATPGDIVIRISVFNRGPASAPIVVVPQFWFRNSWSWTAEGERPSMSRSGSSIAVSHPSLPPLRISWLGAPELLWCENDTNANRVFGESAPPAPSKDGINDAIIHGDRSRLCPAERGTKVGLMFSETIAAGGRYDCVMVLGSQSGQAPPKEVWCTSVIRDRAAECDEFYAAVQDRMDSEDEALVQRQAFAGLLWSKQLYRYTVRTWLKGDPGQPVPPASRLSGRNSTWMNLEASDVISMPDTWEYPWFAAWDLAFHCIPFAVIDPAFAKEQLLLLVNERYQHPNGQIPAYEWNFSDVNPPVHAWAAWRVYQMDRRITGAGDTEFLERVFHKLLLNFTWWVNRKDELGRNIFQGGFLGLDNIGLFDRSSEMPGGGHLEQSDGTAWMAMYCLNMMRIALELSLANPVYQDLAGKFFEHFLAIAHAMMNMGGQGISLWNDEDEFYYDVLHLPNGEDISLRVRSIVGLIPLYAVEVLEPELLEKVPQFSAHVDAVLAKRPDLSELVSRWHTSGSGERRLLSLLRGHRMKCLLRRMLDEQEFLSDYGVRALSRYHRDHPFALDLSGHRYEVRYAPGESDIPLFGGNSNWRGPIWFPVNYLLIEALERFHHYYGDDFFVECPVGSGTKMTIRDVTKELRKRLGGIFLRDGSGRRPVFGDYDILQTDEHFRDYIPFYEYFHGDTGRGVGASHQTGWTALIAKVLQPPRAGMKSVREGSTKAGSGRP